jgi:hypothetical protein
VVTLLVGVWDGDRVISPLFCAAFFLNWALRLVRGPSGCARELVSIRTDFRVAVGRGPARSRSKSRRVFARKGPVDWTKKWAKAESNDLQRA